MAKSGDESDYDSAHEDEYNGGVSLAEYGGSIMELDTQEPFLGYANGALQQGFSPIDGHFQDGVPSLESSDEQSERMSATGDSPLWDIEATGTPQGGVNHFPTDHAITTQLPTVEPDLPGPPFEDHGSSVISESPHPADNSSASVDHQIITHANTLVSIHSLIHVDDLATYNTVSDTSFEFSQSQAGAVDAESYFTYPQMPTWVADLQGPGNQFAAETFNSYGGPRDMSFIECLRFWHDVHKELPKGVPRYSRTISAFSPFLRDDSFPVELASWGPKKVTNYDVHKRKCDHQGIKWDMSKLSRRDAREIRRKVYCNHANLITSYPFARTFNNWALFRSAPYMNLKSRGRASIIPDTEKYFRFNRIDLEHEISIPHFQLRHIISASSKNAVFYPTVINDTTGSHITSINPEVEGNGLTSDLTINSAMIDYPLDYPLMQKIYTLTAKNDVLIAGGLQGEYAMKSLTSRVSGPFTSGMVSQAPNPAPTTCTPTHPAAAASPSPFLSHHDHVKAVNCAATSPDTRLRLLVRDAKHPLIVEADTGKRIGKLSGHSDFGFACDWSDDGRHMATGAQDGIVQIYDMRQWREPLQTLAAELGGVRALAFSPLGSGPPVLLLAESADFVHVVDAVGFGREQTIDFFGEVAGVSFEPEGRRFWVGVADPDVGGLMEFEREDGGARFGVRGSRWDEEEV